MLLGIRRFGEESLFLLFVLLSAVAYCHCDKSIETKRTNPKCVITEPKFKTDYDFTQLRSDLGHVFEANKLFRFEFNICGTIAKCNGQTDVGACLKLKAEDKEVVIGYKDEGIVKNGLMYYNYVGESCGPSASNYSLSVLLECDYSNAKEPVSLISKTGCEYYLKLKTRHACAPVKPMQCQYKVSENRIIDFSPLSKGNRITDTSDTTYILNVCNPVVYGQQSMCGPSTGICEYNKTAQSYKTIGEYDGKFAELKKMIVLEMQSGEKCVTDPKRNASSKIIFQCDEREGHPTHEVDFNCTHYFVWPTRLVCDSAVVPCVAIDPITNFKFDLNPLANKAYSVTNKGTTYDFGICGASPNCLETAGACKKSGQSFGKVNDRLMFNTTGAPYLNYTDGPVCSGDKKWFTKIEFICPEHDEDNVPYVLEDTDCRLIIQFATTLVCSNQVSCKATEGTVEYDLTPLIGYTSNYEAEVSEEMQKKAKSDNVKYYVNVCRPLVPQYGLSCKGGSAACRVNMIGGKPENETSLGFPDISLTVINTSAGMQPVLKYLRGDICGKDNKEMESSSIEFLCNSNVGLGKPKLINVTDECQHIFTWETSIICPNAAIEYRMDNCTLFNKNTSQDFNLKNVGHDGIVPIDNGSKQMELNLCKPTNYRAEIDYSNGIAHLYSHESHECGDLLVKYTFECRQESNLVIYNTSGLCSIEIKYESPLVCPLLGLTVDQVTMEKTTTTATTTTTTTAVPATSVKPPLDGKLGQEAAAAANAEGGMSAWGVIGILFLISVVVGVGLLARSQERRTRFLNLIRRKNPTVSYTRDFDEPYYSI